ncbi:MAG: alpha/beta hydrolase [Anaerolineae bacterium]
MGQTAAAIHTDEDRVKRHEFFIDGAKIVAVDRGSGIPMLFLHGSPDTHAMWLPVIERLGNTVRAVAPDLPGFGQATLPKGFSLGLDHFAEVIRGILDQLSISEPVILAGTDFGAHYGLAFAVKYPERVRGIVMSNATFFRDYQWHSFAKLYRVPLLGELMLNTTPKIIMKKALKRFAPALPNAYIAESYATGFGSPSVRKAILRMYREREPQHFIGWDDQLAALMKQKPTLILWGDKDPFAAKHFAERFGVREVYHFAEYSHWLPLEAPDQYAEKVLRWLKSV